MNALRSMSVIACVCCIACSLISIIAPLGKMRKIVNLVLGLFIICSMLIPLVGLFTTDIPDLNLEEQYSDLSLNEKEYEKLILNETADNLVVAANELLLSENIQVDNIEIGIKKTDNNSIYISRINIYISKDLDSRADEIKRIISTNMSKEPVVIVSEN
ncbi:MAG: stage III sporulation protein AF [Ruminococcus sp.]|nr:stage III sporulation protein AF [Ruminococcus sp.]